jgi:hypothetical protein
VPGKREREREDGRKRAGESERSCDRRVSIVAVEFAFVLLLLLLFSSS